MWVVGEVLPRDPWTTTSPFGGSVPSVLLPWVMGHVPWPQTSSVLLFLPLSCL